MKVTNYEERTERILAEASAEERYDLVIPREHYESDPLAALLEVIRGDEFPREVEALGGYDVSETGRALYQLEGDGEVATPPRS